jgi:uncharacterized protein DUF3551
MTNKIKIALGGALFVLTLSASSNAQEQLRKNETFCLQSGASGGGAPLMCSFETREQCLASKTANSDWCMENPVIGFRKRGY